MADGKESKAIKPVAPAPAKAKAKGPGVYCPKCPSTNLQIEGQSAHCPYCNWTGKVEEMAQSY